MSETITLGQLKDKLSKLNDEQLAQPVVWWGDEKGGIIYDLIVLKENYLNYGEGFEPESCFTKEDIKEYGQYDDILLKGTVVLDIDPKPITNE